MAHKLRFLGLAAIIAIGVICWNGMILAFINLDTTYNNAFAEHNMAGFTIQSANPQGTGSDAFIDYRNLTSYMEEFKASEPRVISYELRIVYDTVFNIRGNRQNGRIVAFNTTGPDGTFRSQPSVNGYLLLEGRELRESDKYLNVCYVEGHLSQYWKLTENEFIGVGEEITSFQVLGSVASPEYLMNMGSYADLLPSPRRFGVIFMPLRTAAQILNVPGRVNEISVKTQAGISVSARESIAKDLKGFLEEGKGLKLSDPVDLDKQVAYWLLRLDIEEAREFGVVLPLIFFIMAMFGLYVLLGRMVVAERKDIGVAQALGYSRGAIIKQYVGIASVIAAIGSIIGTIGGIFFANEFSPLYVNMVTILFPGYVNVNIIVVTIGLFLGVLTGLIGGYLPVRNAIQPLPAESLRFDPSLHITSGKIPLFERILRKLRINLKVTGFRLPVRNFFRSKRRTFSSVAGVLISVSIISMGFGMVESMNVAFQTQYEVVEDWDIRIDYSNLITNTTETIQALENIEGVTNAAPQLVSGATMYSDFSIKNKEVQLFGMLNNSGYFGHKFFFQEGSFDPEGIVISRPIADKLKVGINDPVILEIANLTYLESLTPLQAHYEFANVTFQVSGIVDEFNGLVAYVGIEKLIEISTFPLDSCSSIVLKLENPDNIALSTIKSEIWSGLDYNVRNVYSREEQASDLLRLLDLIYGLMYILAIFAIGLAVIMVYNTVYINLQEQTREIATLLTIGTPRRNILRNVTIENTVITIIGTFLGLIFGYILLWFFMDVVLNMEFFRIKIFISNSTIYLSFFLTWFGVLFAQFFPLRKILNLNLAEATKERVV